MNKNTKKLMKLEYGLKTNSPKILYNYAGFEKPINIISTDAIIKRRSRGYSKVRHSKIKKECKFCLSKDNLQIHHKNYKNPDNIIILYRKCHIKMHRKK